LVRWVTYEQNGDDNDANENEFIDKSALTPTDKEQGKAFAK